MRTTTTLTRSIDTTPEAVRAFLRAAAEHAARMAVAHEAELSPEGLRFVQHAAFWLWLDSREPLRLTPIAEVLG